MRLAHGAVHWSIACRMHGRKYAFFGHSMGAMIAFDLARWLRRNGLPAPVQLFVSGRPAPQIPDPDPPTYNLPDAEFLEYLSGHIRAVEG